MEREELEMIEHTEYLKSIYDNQLASARDEGKLEGRLEGTTEIARKLLSRNRQIDEIMEDTGLTRKEVEALRTSLKSSLLSP